MWLVELAPVSDPAFVPRAIAAVLGVREEPNRPLVTTLLEDLHGKTLLLLLDNCEHLIDACAQFADAVLRSGAAARILATSREGLGIPGELTWRAPSLQTPNPSGSIEMGDLAHYESVRLFVERARFALPGFALNAANAPAVRQICTRLDGIPLAIELADTEEGARVRDRHLDYFARLGREVGPQLQGEVGRQLPGVGRSDPARAMKRLQPELDNVRSALEWTIETARVDLGLELVAHRAYFFVWILLAAQSELLEWHLRLLAQRSPGEGTLAQGWAMYTLSEIYHRQGEWDQASAAAENALSIGVTFEDPRLQSTAYAEMALINMRRGQLELARSYAEKCRSIVTASKLFDERERARHLDGLFGSLAFYEGDYKQAQAMFAQVHRLAARDNSTITTSAIARGLGYTTLYQNDVTQAGAWFRESLVDISFFLLTVNLACLYPAHTYHS